VKQITNNHEFLLLVGVLELAPFKQKLGFFWIKRHEGLKLNKGKIINICKFIIHEHFFIHGML
jgi:hypothetical protein